MTKYGFFQLDITPPLGCSMPGYFEKREAEDILSPLFAKAIVADDGDRVSAICVFDGLCVVTEICERVVERVSKETGIDPSGILIQATHIHTGGPVRPGDDVASNLEMGTRYREVLEEKLGDCIILAYKRRTEMTAVYNKKEVYGVSFVRNYYMADGSVRTNPPFNSKDIVKRVAETDPDMPYLFFTDTNGKARGALVNFACHHDCVCGSEISPDYSGILAKRMREKFGEDFICVLMNGFCGNINNWDCIGATCRPPVEDHIRIGETLADALISSLPEAKKMENESLDYKKEYITVKRREIDPDLVSRAKMYLDKERVNVDISDAQGDSYLIATAPAIMRIYGDDAPKEFNLCAQAIRLGDCIIYALPGEMYSQYGEYLKKNAPTDKVFLAELANTRTQYVPIPELYNSPNVYEASPTAAILHEGGGMELTKKAEELGNKLF